MKCFCYCLLKNFFAYYVKKPPSSVAGWWLWINDMSQNNESAAAGSDFDLAGRDGLAAQAGKFIVFTQHQFLAVQAHGAAAHTGLTGKGIDSGFTGQFYGGSVSPAGVDHQIC